MKYSLTIYEHLLTVRQDMLTCFVNTWCHIWKRSPIVTVGLLYEYVIRFDVCHVTPKI